MTDSQRYWPGMAAICWKHKTDLATGRLSSRVAVCEGLGLVGEVIADGPAFLTAHYPDGRGLSLRLPGKGTKKGLTQALVAIYGEDPAHLPTPDELAQRWQAWMEGRLPVSGG